MIGRFDFVRIHWLWTAWILSWNYSLLIYDVQMNPRLFACLPSCVLACIILFWIYLIFFYHCIAINCLHYCLSFNMSLFPKFGSSYCQNWSFMLVYIWNLSSLTLAVIWIIESFCVIEQFASISRHDACSSLNRYSRRFVIFCYIYHPK